MLIQRRYIVVQAHDVTQRRILIRLFVVISAPIAVVAFVGTHTTAVLATLHCIIA